MNMSTSDVATSTSPTDRASPFSQADPTHPDSEEPLCPPAAAEETGMANGLRRDADGRLWSADGIYLCGKDGCTKPAWHSGLCVAVFGSRRDKKPVQTFTAEPAPSSRELIRQAREEGRLPPAKKPKPPSEKQQQPGRGDGAEGADFGAAEQEGSKQPRKRRVSSEGGAGVSRRPRIEEPPEPRVGARGGTRSHGAPTWTPDELAAIDAARGPVTAALRVRAGGGVQLGLSVSVRAQPRGPKELRDYLAKGAHDKAANESCTSEAEAVAAARTAQRGVRWGCLCQGHVLNGGIELTCRRCSLVFHAKCERLDYSSAELKRMEAQGSYVCAECDRFELRDAGYDPSRGRFVWKCRHCTRTFEAEEHHAAEMHGRRCAAQLSKREWSCACGGKMGQSMMATHCRECEHWFHSACKTQKGAAWDQAVMKKHRDVCAACEQKAFNSRVGLGQQPAKRNTAGERHDRVVSALEQHALPGALPLEGRDEVGTLAEGRVDVRKSTLGEHAGLGLFTRVPFKQHEVIASYYGTTLFRETLEPDADTSYIMRLPDSGGALINGKPFADAIRANPRNPTADGRYYPCECAPEWHLGPGAMANDPRDPKRNNAQLRYVKPKDGHKALRELALVRPVLVATRDLQPDEEVFYSYGSEKPFEHLRKQLAAQKEKEKNKGKADVCKLVWVPNDEAESLQA